MHLSSDMQLSKAGMGDANQIGLLQICCIATESEEANCYRENILQALCDNDLIVPQKTRSVSAIAELRSVLWWMYANNNFSAHKQ